MNSSSSLELQLSAVAVMRRQVRSRQGRYEYLNMFYIGQSCVWQCCNGQAGINNFNSMEQSQIIQSPPIRKISNSSQQFRLLIDSLRHNNKHRPAVVETTVQSLPKPEAEVNEESTVVQSDQKNSSQSNNFILPIESDSRLQAKLPMEVGDRDKLRKKYFILDNNPELDLTPPKEKANSRLEASIQVESALSKDMILIGVSPKKNMSTQYEGFQLQDLSQMSTPREDGRTGQIKKQMVKYEETNEACPQSTKKIKDISENVVLEYIKRENKISEKSDPSEIFNFFTNLCLSCDVLIKSPSIKKYKNCIYFGFPISKEASYEGFLYFYDGKIYYGDFLNGFKHGLGVELNFSENSTSKGEFKEGHKTGKFYIEKPNEKYIGYLENGLYQGEGRLTTEDYVYEGLFDKGEKNGYGEEFYSKTGLKITGTFKNGVLERSKASKSIPEIRNKSKIPSLKKEDRLELVRRKSLEKHNHRMTKIRNPCNKESEYEIQFDTAEEYREPPKLQVNPSKLEMYRQPPQKLPKICQQFEYSFENGRNFESISSHHDSHRHQRSVPKHKQEYILGEIGERVGTAQLEQPLPTPCLTHYKRRR